ncbi:hypothetical protein CDAR_9011 [Caerostris darwini]|uniref:Uncharacterized protein n=1 Tax=Caerostris darwini TaxID=1538125 RepID=A0AAV4SW88_9ARAC|nr:hypothetical protein CDAR_9011 [Caerostris darwini]
MGVDLGCEGAQRAPPEHTRRRSQSNCARRLHNEQIVIRFSFSGTLQDRSVISLDRNTSRRQWNVSEFMNLVNDSLEFIEQ